MHIINECPRCKKDFMYHQTDGYLRRDITVVDEVGNNEIIETVICQDCHLEEKWIGKEVKVINPDYSHLNDFKLVVDGILTDENLPLTVKIGDTDSYEWFDEEELEIVNYEKERLFRAVKISERLPDMGKRVMFLDENYEGEFMQDYHPNEKVEIKKNKFIQLMDCHFVTDYLKNNYTHWLEEISPKTK